MIAHHGSILSSQWIVFAFDLTPLASWLFPSFDHLIGFGLRGDGHSILCRMNPHRLRTDIQNRYGDQFRWVQLRSWLCCFQAVRGSCGRTHIHCFEVKPALAMQRYASYNKSFDL